MPSGTELDIEDPVSLVAYLRGRQAIDSNETPILNVLAGGVSNRTVLVKRTTGEAWVMKQALPKLRVNVDWFSSPERIAREAAGLEWLSELGIRVPGLKFKDFRNYVLAMDFVPEPHENWKNMLLGGRLEPRHVVAFAEMLANIHTRSGARRDEIARAFDDRTYFESLRMEPYYLYTAEQVPAARDFLELVIRTTRSTRVCLVHGDYSPKNILINDDRLFLLDHEVAHFGDPAFDLGFSLTHLLSKANHVAQHRSAFHHAAITYWTVYWAMVASEPWFTGLEQRAVNSTLACLLARVAGRSQLEYMDESERARQRGIVVELVSDGLSTIRALIDRFVSKL